MNRATILHKHWNQGNVLRDDAMSYGVTPNRRLIDRTLPWGQGHRRTKRLENVYSMRFNSILDETTAL